LFLYLVTAINYDMQVGSGQLTVRQAYERAFSVNVASAHVLTEVFVDLLLLSKAPRIVFITTSIASLNEHSDPGIPLNHAPPAGWPKQGYFSLPTYRASKAAMNMMILEWAKTLKNDGVIVHAVNPGLLATSFGGMTKEMHAAMYAVDPMLGGKLVKSVVEGERDADIGKMISAEGTIQW
jgi:NAD(P)-dependent dehydrogenase (short-subunit alcohol dehydrogenase family)